MSAASPRRCITIIADCADAGALSSPLAGRELHPYQDRDETLYLMP